MSDEGKHMGIIFLNSRVGWVGTDPSQTRLSEGVFGMAKVRPNHKKLYSVSNPGTVGLALIRPKYCWAGQCHTHILLGLMLARPNSAARPNV
jgi:hypothetical protein